MLTVPEAARRVHRNPETVRRWIREGRLRYTRVGTQYLVDEADLDAISGDEGSTPMPDWMRLRPDGRPQPDWVRLVRDSRRGH
jgi:excisionase family DNA binding protein